MALDRGKKDKKDNGKNKISDREKKEEMQREEMNAENERRN